MKHFSKQFFSIAALFSVTAVLADSNNLVTPTIVARSQGRHADRQKMVAEVDQTHRYNLESWYGTMDIAVGYMRTFREKDLAFCLFGNDLNCDSCAPTIKVQGSGVASRDAKAWLADYLYLNCEFDGSFTVKPRIQNVMVDLDFYLGLDEWVNGMYFRIYGPINWTKWQTNFCSTDTGLTTSCSAGYFTPSGSEVLLTSLGSYFQGDAPASVDNITFKPLRFAKMGCGCQTETGFADLRLELGWNFLQDEDYHLGLNIQAAAPTGSRRNATFVLQPVVGNGKHWELGAGLTGHYIFWRSDDEEKHFGFYVDANLTHLFNAKETRTFDLDNGNNSRYMLATKFTKTVTNNLGGKTTAGATGSATGFTLATAQFDNVYNPVANLTTIDVNVSVGVQADIVAMFNFTARGFSWDIGYDFWGRSCEKFGCSTDCECNPENLFNPSQRNTWALKGDARMFGYAGATAGSVTADQAIPLSATDSASTIHNGSNAASTSPIRNFGVDRAQFAYTGSTSAAAMVIHTPLAQGGFNVAGDQIKTSIQPVFLSQDDVQLTETKGTSNKVFTHFSYAWDRDNWVPYLGVGGSAEFGHGHSCCGDNSSSCSTSSCSTSSCSTSSSCNNSSSCSNCVNCALTQWAVWVKGGLSFN